MKRFIIALCLICFTGLLFAELRQPQADPPVQHYTWVRIRSRYPYPTNYNHWSDIMTKTPDGKTVYSYPTVFIYRIDLWFIRLNHEHEYFDPYDWNQSDYSFIWKDAITRIMEENPGGIVNIEDYMVQE